MTRSTSQQRSWYWYDWANSAYVTTTATVLMGPYMTTLAKRAACPGQDTALACHEDLSVLGIPVDPGSLSSYVMTAVTIVSAILLVLVGAAADRSERPHRMLGGFAWVGAVAACCMVALQGDRWQLAVVLTAVAGLALNGSLVVYDALLCRIARPDDRDHVSSRGWAFGYLGGGLLLAVNLALLTLKPFGMSTEEAVRLNLLLAGLWWFGFTFVPVLGLRRVPRFTDPDEAAQMQAHPERATALGALRQLRDTFVGLRAYPQTLLFLAAALFFNDGVQSVIASSSVYGAEELGFGQSVIMLTFLVVQLVAFGGALMFGRLAARFGARRTVLGSLMAWVFVVCVGFVVPAGNFPLFMLLGVLIGIVLGGTQALSRSMFSQLVPRGREAEYFSLYQALERGTSWFGMFTFGLVHQLTGSYRPSIIALIVFFVVGGLLLSRVRMAEGIRAAGNEVPELV